MRQSAVQLLTVFVLALSSAIAFAQDAGGSAVGARIVPGVALQRELFGEDLTNPKTGAGFTLGGQLCMNRSVDRAVVVEATMPFSWLNHPGGGESARPLPILVGYQGGRDTYFRASIGLALVFGKSGSRRYVEAGFAASVAVGRNFGTNRLVATEAVLRIAGFPEYLNISLGAQVPVGRCTR